MGAGKRGKGGQKKSGLRRRCRKGTLTGGRKHRGEETGEHPEKLSRCVYQKTGLQWLGKRTFWEKQFGANLRRKEKNQKGGGNIEPRTIFKDRGKGDGATDYCKKGRVQKKNTASA